MRAQARLVKMCSGAGILQDFEGSDHWPVYADLHLPAPLPKGPSAPALELRNRRTGTGALSALLLSALQRAWCNSSWWLLFFLGFWLHVIAQVAGNGR